MNERIQLILKTKNISASRLADEIGVQRSNISHILSGRNNPSLEFIQKLLKRFPDLNSDWIIFGKGSMYNSPDLFTSVEEQRVLNAGGIMPVVAPERKRTDRTRNTVERTLAGKPQHIAEEGISSEILHEKVDIPESSVKNEAQAPGIVLKNAGKKIDKVIIFYSDKSCMEYTPE